MSGGGRRRFEGLALLVTGSTGMAADAALALAAEGASILVASRRPENARALAERIVAGGGRAAWHGGDLATEPVADEAVAACVAAFGRLDALYGVAGMSARRDGDGRLDEMTLAGWETALRANATSQFLVCRAAVRAMLAQAPRPLRLGDGSTDPARTTRGTLLTMSSALARHPSPDHFGTHGYAAAKGAIESFTRAVAAAYAADGIRANAIAPSLVTTPMSGRATGDPAILGYLRGKQPLAGGPLQPGDVTEVALHLLSDEARMVTGQVVAVDGGWSVAEGR
ncbi:MAG: hypothetical protein RL338_1471 [Chloroflexota bacterium]